MKKIYVSFIILTTLFLLFTTVNAAEMDVWEKAKAEGVQFRAVGNEPGWLVEIYDDQRVRFVNNYGEMEIKAPVDDLWIGPVGEDKIYYIENDAVQFQVIIMNKSYQDTMSGEEFPYQARVVFPNHSYVGGGRLLNKVENQQEEDNNAL